MSDNEGEKVRNHKDKVAVNVPMDNLKGAWNVLTQRQMDIAKIERVIRMQRLRAKLEQLKLGERGEYANLYGETGREHFADSPEAGIVRPTNPEPESGY